MAAAPAANLPRVRIPAVRVDISKQYILVQALKALGVNSCEITTCDYFSDDIVAAVCIDISPHGDNPFGGKKLFYGEPMRARDEAIESAHAAALSYLQDEDIIFVDDANLQALKKCKHSLLQTTSWSELFETKCISQQAEIAAMVEHIQQITLEAPLSPPTDDDMIKDIMNQDVPLVHQEHDFIQDLVLPDMPPPAVQPIIDEDELDPANQSTPSHENITSEAANTPHDMPVVIPSSLATTKTNAASVSSDSDLMRTSTRRGLHFNEESSHST